MIWTPPHTKTCASASRSRCTSPPADAKRRPLRAGAASTSSLHVPNIMKILVLGSGAGGGFPQWNCNCALCSGARRGTTRAAARTQSSIAVSADGERWVLLNASPDLGHQIRSQPRCIRASAPRDTPIEAVVLMDAQIDHVTGLLSLREGPPIELYCTPCVFEDLTSGLPLAAVAAALLRRALARAAGGRRRRVAEFHIDALPGLRLRAMAIAGKAPPYSPHRHDPAVGDNIALVIDDLDSGERAVLRTRASRGSASASMRGDGRRRPA